MEENIMEHLGAAVHRLLQVRYSLPIGALPLGEFLMLQLIHHHREEEPQAKGVYVSQLTRHAHASKPAVSRTLRHLEDKGLLRRQTDPEDRRTTYVMLTAEGERLLEQCRIQTRELARRVARRMGEDELRALTEQLDRLTDAIQAEGKQMSAEQGE